MTRREKCRVKTASRDGVHIFVRHARLGSPARPCGTRSSRKRYMSMIGMNTARPCGPVASKRKLILVYMYVRGKRRMEGKGPPRPGQCESCGKEEEGQRGTDKNI